MALKPAQQTALGDFIAADPTLSAIPNSNDGAYALASLLNLPASPAFVIWRSAVTLDEITQDTFDWARVDNLSVGKARIWEWMFTNANRVINPSRRNVRAGIDAAWVGTAADLAVRAAVYARCKRSATLAEKILATGVGSDASPATAGFEGNVTYFEVSAARGG